MDRTTALLNATNVKAGALPGNYPGGLANFSSSTTLTPQLRGASIDKLVGLFVPWSEE